MNPFALAMQAATQHPAPRQQRKPIVFWANPKGIFTNVDARLLTRDDLKEATNFRLVPKMVEDKVSLVLASRPGLKRVTATTTNSKAIKHAAYCPISGTYKFLLIDSDHKLYECTGSEPALVAGSSKKTLQGEATILPFDDQALILDGSYLKIWDGTSVELAYDNGTGARARLIHTSCETLADTPSQNLYSGSYTRAGAQITTPSWTSGYTIPLTRAKFWLSRTGDPTGNVTAAIYNSDGSNLLATATTTLSATKLTTNAKLFEFTWSLSATQDMAPSTSYIIAILYSGGSATDYVTVHGYTEASGGDCYRYDGSWANVGTAGIAIDVYPSLPPKAKFGAVYAGRPYIAGDPDYPGRLWYGNLSALDWSTENGGGYVSAVDTSSSGFKIGAVLSQFGDLVVFGTDEQPFACLLSGDSPSNYELSPSQQNVNTTHKTAIAIANDIYFSSGSGVMHLAGTEVKGDLITYPVSERIQDAIEDNWDDDAFAGYYPKDGLYLLKLTGKTNILACHTQLGGKIWTEWALANSVTPHCFMTAQNECYMGGSDGHLYRFDISEHQDNSNALTYSLLSGKQDSPFGTVIYERVALSVVGSVTSYRFDIYVDGSGTAKETLYMSSPTDIEQKTINVEGDTVQIGLDTFVVTGHFYVAPIVLQARKLTRSKN